MNSEFFYGILLGMQIICGIIVLYNIWIAFIVLMIICFLKGMLYQYEYFRKEK